jgi:hypothetical protein
LSRQEEAVLARRRGRGATGCTVLKLFSALLQAPYLQQILPLTRSTFYSGRDLKPKSLNISTPDPRP